MPQIFNVNNKKNLNGDKRLKISDPTSILSLSELQYGINLIDLGCGTGYYAIPASHIVKNGLIYAIDLQMEMLNTLQKKLRELSINNIHIIHMNM